MGGSGQLLKDVWHREARNISVRNAIQLRRWGMRVTVFNDPVADNNGDWVLVYDLSSESKQDNANWQKKADLSQAWGGGGSTITFGDPTQIPYVNATSDDFDYSPSITWNDATKTLLAADGVTLSGSSSWSSIFGELHTISGIFNDGIIAGESHLIQGIAGDDAIFGRDNTLGGAGTKNFNLMAGDDNTITAGIGETANYNFVTGNLNLISGNSNFNFISGNANSLYGTNNSAIVAGNGIIGTESNTLYTMNFSMDGFATGNITSSSFFTVQPGADFFIADAVGTAFTGVAEGNVQMGTTVSLLTFNDGSAPIFTSAPGLGGVHYASDYRSSYVDRSLVDWGNVLSAKTYTGKQTMFANTSTAGFNLGSTTVDPSGAADGDVWYDTATQRIRARVNGNNISLYPSIVNPSALNELPATVSVSVFQSSRVFMQTTGAQTGLIFGSTTDSNQKVLSTAAPGGSGSDLTLSPQGFSTGIANVIIGNVSSQYPRIVFGGTQMLVQNSVQSDFTISNQNITTGGTTGNLVLRTNNVSSSQPGNVNIIGGSPLVSGNFNGGSVNITAGDKFGTGVPGNITFNLAAGGRMIMTNLPTSSAGLPSGAVWNNAGTLSIVP